MERSCFKGCFCSKKGVAFQIGRSVNLTQGAVGLVPNLHRRHGFTLIELLVVVLIVGILVAVAVPQYEKALLNTRLQRLKPLTKALVQAQKSYYLAHGKYTALFTDLDITLTGGYQQVYGTLYSMFYFSNGRNIDHCTLQLNHAECVDVSSGTWMVYRQYYSDTIPRECRVSSPDLNILANQVCKKDTKDFSGSTYGAWTTWKYM